MLKRLFPLLVMAVAFMCYAYAIAKPVFDQ